MTPIFDCDNSDKFQAPIFCQNRFFMFFDISEKVYFARKGVMKTQKLTLFLVKMECHGSKTPLGYMGHRFFDMSFFRKSPHIAVPGHLKSIKKCHFFSLFLTFSKSGPTFWRSTQRMTAFTKIYLQIFMIFSDFGLSRTFKVPLKIYNLMGITIFAHFWFFMFCQKVMIFDDFFRDF